MRDYAIFFDVDGVLINGFHSNPDLTNRWDKNIEEDLGIQTSDLTEKFFQGPFMDVIVGARDCEEALEDVLPHISDSVTAKDLMAYWFEKDSELNHDVMETVRALSVLENVKLFVATNQEHHRAKYLWEQVGFQNYFEDIYYSARLGCLKENPHYFRRIIWEQNLEGLEVLFFDDSPKNIDVANQLGWQGVVFNTIADLNEHNVIQDLLRQADEL